MRGELTTKSYKRSRAYSLVLLCLMAHALFVCFTHHHNARPDLSSSATASISATSDSDSENSTDSGSDAHCLSCRLQRNLISDHPAASLVVALIPEALEPRSKIRPTSFATILRLLLWSRAADGLNSHHR